MSLRSLPACCPGEGDGHAEILVDRDVAVHDHGDMDDARRGEGCAGRDGQGGRRGIRVLGDRDTRGRRHLRQVHGGRDLLRSTHGDDLRGAAAGPGRVGRAGEGVGVVRLNDRIGVGDIDDGDLVCRFNGHVVAPFVISSIRT